MWFRIETHRDGSIASCVQVEGSIKDGRGVHYVEADSKQQAISILVARYDRRREKGKLLKRELRAKRKAAAICCQCQKPTDGLKLLCFSCNEANNKRSRERGEPATRTDRPAAEKVAAEQRIREANRLRVGKRNGATWARLAVLRACLKQLESNPRHLKTWLIAEIDKITAKDSKSEKAA